MRVVVWSGGLDSTLLLADELSKANGYGVRAMTLLLDGFIHIPQGQREGEKRARAEFKKWARKKHGWKFRHDVVRVRTKADIDTNVGQSGMWLSHLIPYIRDRDQMLFGYIRGDDFWHWRALFEEAFRATKRSHYAADAKIEFPFEWHRKVDLIAGAKQFKIPQRCWWTCSTEKVRKTQCGRCLKCRDVKRAKADLKEFGDDVLAHGVRRIKPTERLLEPSLGQLAKSLDSGEVEKKLIATMSDDISKEIDEEVVDHIQEIRAALGA